MRQRLLRSAWTLTVLLACSPHATAASADVAAIRQARAAMNQAFDAHNMPALASFMTDTLTLTGPVWRLVGRSQVAEAHEQFWKQRPDVTWDYTPAEIRVFDQWHWLSERGTWIQRWTAEDGPTELRGTYQAFWKYIDGRWRLDAHLFVTTSCRGGAFCDRSP